MIYFIQLEDYGPIKIGYTYSADAKLRLVELQIGCPWRLVLRGMVPGTMKDEQRLHAVLAAHRMYGEWFTPHVEVIEMITGLIGPLSNLNLLPRQSIKVPLPMVKARFAAPVVLPSVEMDVEIPSPQPGLCDDTLNELVILLAARSGASVIEVITEAVRDGLKNHLNSMSCDDDIVEAFKEELRS